MEQMINLLPWREQRQQACRRFWGQLLAYAVGLMALITLGCQVKAGQDKQIATLWLQSDAQMLSALKAKQPHFQAQHQLWLKQQARMQRHNQTRQWQQRLAELAEKMPDSAWLTEVHFSARATQRVGDCQNVSVIKRTGAGAGHDRRFSSSPNRFDRARCARVLAVSLSA